MRPAHPAWMPVVTMGCSIACHMASHVFGASVVVQDRRRKFAGPLEPDLDPPHTTPDSSVNRPASMT